MPVKTTRIGVGPLVAQNIDEHPVTPLGMQAVDCGIENLIVVHWLFVLLADPYRGPVAPICITLATQYDQSQTCTMGNLS